MPTERAWNIGTDGPLPAIVSRPDLQAPQNVHYTDERGSWYAIRDGARLLKIVLIQGTESAAEQAETGVTSARAAAAAAAEEARNAKKKALGGKASLGTLTPAEIQELLKLLTGGT